MTKKKQTTNRTNLVNASTTVVKKDGTKITNIIHLSDIHIQRNIDRYEEYKSIFVKLEAELDKYDNSSTIIVITGDIVDFKTNITVEGMMQTIEFFTILSKKKDVVYIAGNHDVNVSFPKNKSVLDIIVKYFNSNNKLFYLKESGLYEYNNLIFSVSSVFDKKIIDPNTIKSKKTKIFLYHGFVKCPKLDYLLQVNKKIDFIETDKIQNYDMCLLGDIHSQVFIEDNIAYASSLVQQKFDEKLNENHGYILWNVSERRGKFINITNDYGLMQVNIVNNTINPNQLKYIPKHCMLKIIYDNNTDTSTITKLINDVNPTKYIKIKKYDKNNKTDVKNKIKDIENISFEEYCTNVKKMSNDMARNILNIHKYYCNGEKQIGKNENTNNITFLELNFSNVFGYGSGNKLKFNNNSEISLISAENKVGKSAIIDILLFVLYGKYLRNDGRKKDIMNVNTDNYECSLFLEINGEKYTIKRTGRIKWNRLDHESHLAKWTNNKWEPIAVCQNTFNSKMAELLSCSYEDMVNQCMMPQYNCTNIINMGNHERIKMLTEIFNMTHYNILHKKAKKDLEKVSDRIKTLQNMVDDYETKIKSFDEKTFDDILKENIMINEEYEAKNIELMTEKLENIMDHEKLVKEYNDLETKLNILSKEIVECNKQIESANEKNKQITTHDLYNHFTGEFLKNIKEKVSKHMYKKLQKLIEPQKTQNVTDICGLIHANYDELLKLNKQKYIIENSICETKKNIDNYKEKIKTNGENIKKNKIINDKHNQYRYLCERKKESDRKTLEVHCLITSLTHYKNEKKRTEQKIKSLVDHEILLKNYVDIIKLTGYPKLLITNLCNVLNDYINSILLNFNIKVKFDVDVSDKKLVLNIDNEISENKYIECLKSSGFEYFIINFAFKLAIRNLSNCKTPSFFIMDESLSCVDKLNMENINIVFDFLRDNFSSIYLMTHNKEIENKVDSLIQVKKKGDGFSYLIN